MNRYRIIRKTEWVTREEYYRCQILFREYGENWINIGRKFYSLEAALSYIEKYANPDGKNNIVWEGTK